MSDLTISDLNDLVMYGTVVNVKRSDTGATVIRNVKALSNSKDKRQKEKWEAFKDVVVNTVAPSADLALAKRYNDVVRLVIDAYIFGWDYQEAMEKIKGEKE